MTESGRRKVESVLIVRSAFGEIHELAWLKALRDLGINAELFDTHSYIPANLAGRLEQRCLLGPHIAKVNRMVVERVRDMRPDVAHFYQGHHYTAETIAQIAKMTFTSGLHCDDPFGRPSRREYRLLSRALPHYDGYHVFRPCNVAEAVATGIKRVRVLMMYYIPWMHYPCQLSIDEQETWGSDVVYAGHMEPDLRVECLARAVRAGLKCRIFGGETEWRSGFAARCGSGLAADSLRQGSGLPARALCKQDRRLFLQQVESRSVHDAILGNPGLRFVSSLRTDPGHAGVLLRGKGSGIL